MVAGGRRGKDDRNQNTLAPLGEGVSEGTGPGGGGGGQGVKKNKLCNMMMLLPEVTVSALN